MLHPHHSSPIPVSFPLLTRRLGVMCLITSTFRFLCFTQPASQSFAHLVDSYMCKSAITDQRSNIRQVTHSSDNDAEEELALLPPRLWTTKTTIDPSDLYLVPLVHVVSILFARSFSSFVFLAIPSILFFYPSFIPILVLRMTCDYIVLIHPPVIRCSFFAYKTSFLHSPYVPQTLDGI